MDADAAREAILEIVEDQLRDGDPPQARATLARLTASGFTDDEAKRLIGCALSAEIHRVLGTTALFSDARYLAALEGLPALPPTD